MEINEEFEIGDWVKSILTRNTKGELRKSKPHIWGKHFRGSIGLKNSMVNFSASKPGK